MMVELADITPHNAVVKALLGCFDPLFQLFDVLVREVNVTDEYQLKLAVFDAEALLELCPEALLLLH